MTNAPGEWSDNGVMIEHSRCPRPVMETSVTEVMSELSDNTLRDLCLTNHEARGHTLLYVVMTNTNGHQVSGHVDLADRVAKVSKCRSERIISNDTPLSSTGRRG